MTETVVSSTHQPTIFKHRNYGVWRPKNPGVRGLKMSGVPGPPGFGEPRGGIPSPNSHSGSFNIDSKCGEVAACAVARSCVTLVRRYLSVRSCVRTCGKGHRL